MDSPARRVIVPSTAFSRKQWLFFLNWVLAGLAARVLLPPFSLAPGVAVAIAPVITFPGVAAI